MALQTAALGLASALVPRPAIVATAPGEFVLGPKTRIVASGPALAVADFLRRRLRPATGYQLPIVARGGRGAIVLRIDRRLARLGREGYRLEISPESVRIRASRPAGLFYGVQTLRQALPADLFRSSVVNPDARWAVPAGVVEDFPRFAWRGAMMDVSRHFMPKEFVLKFLDLMALQKLNVFHWHLTDDNGWRIQIDRYPKLTGVGAQTDFSAMNPKIAARSPSDQVGGYYTKDDVREIVRYAADRFITVVPEIEMPGHSNAAILAYPELGNRTQIEQAGGSVTFLGSMDNVLNVEDSTIAFVKNVLDEVLELFPSQFIHIGGDEVWKEPWTRNRRAQEKMKRLGLKNGEELQSWFMRQIDAYLTEKGRRPIGWDEILQGGLPPNSAVMSWRGVEGGIAAARAGHDVVMSPTSHAYLDYYQAKPPTGEPRAIGGFLPLETVYSFEPVPEGLTPAEAKRILGGQGNIWTEYIGSPKQFEYMAYPRLSAMAEVLWSPKEARDWPDFSARLKAFLERLDVLGVAYRRLSPAPRQ